MALIPFPAWRRADYTRIVEISGCEEMKYVCCRRLLSGFSLVELVSVLILIGIISVVAVSRFNATPFQTAGFDQELRSALRFAQKFAITSGCDVQVDVDAATDSYALTLRGDVGALPETCLSASGAFGPSLPSPTGGVFSGTAPAGVVINSGLTFFYDRQGRPSTGGIIDVNGNSITVEPETGYIY
jgi:MSHA pilin protein MshC